MLRNMGMTIMGFALCTVVTAAVHAAPETGGMPMTHETQTHQAATGREVCPVSGEPIDKDTNITYTYKGKGYHFCCSPCIDEFKKNPEKYIEKMKKRENGQVPTKADK